MYTYIQFYLSGIVFTTTYLKAQVWTSMLQLMLSVLLTYMEFQKARHVAAAAEGYTQLPDMEAAAAAAPGDGGRTWISLFVDACLYVWPEDFGLKVRRCGAGRCNVCLARKRGGAVLPFLYHHQYPQKQYQSWLFTTSIVFGVPYGAHHLPLGLSLDA